MRNFRNLLVRNFQGLLKLWYIFIFKIKFLPNYMLDFVRESFRCKLHTCCRGFIWIFNFWLIVWNFKSPKSPRVALFLFQPKNDIFFVMSTDWILSTRPQSIAVNLKKPSFGNWRLSSMHQSQMKKKFVEDKLFWPSIFKLNFLRNYRIGLFPIFLNRNNYSHRGEFICKIAFWALY